MNHIDLEFLVKETIELNEAHEPAGLVIPNAPGLVVKIEELGFSSKILCSESSNLRDDFKDKDKWKDDEDVCLYETSSFFESQLLARHFNNYKYYKEGYQNIATTSLNRVWVLSRLDNLISLTYEVLKPRKFSDELVLGPLGDLSLAEHYLTILQKNLSQDDNFDSMAHKSDRIVFKFSDESKSKKFYESFSKFDFDINFKTEFSNKIDHISLEAYFSELKLIAKVWNNFFLSNLNT